MPLTENRIEHLKASGFLIFWDVEDLLDSMDKSMGKLPPHLERVRSEKNDLDAKIRDLEIFLERDTLPKSVTPQEFDVMQRQLMVMDAYSEILQERLELGKKSNA